MNYEIIREKEINSIDPELIEKCDSREEIVKFSIKKIINSVLELEDGDCRDLELYADIFELLYHISSISNITQEQIEKFSINKLEKYGGYSDLLRKRE